MAEQWRYDARVTATNPELVPVFVEAPSVSDFAAADE